MQELEIIKKFLTGVTTFYKEDCTISLEENDTAYCTEDNKICLPPSLLQEFKDNNLPKFCVFYHELGHSLFSKDSFNLLNEWKNSNANTYNPKYLHLINWIEDFYIEEQMVKHYPYLTDIIRCLKLIPFKYPNDIKYAFNYYYVHKKASPLLGFNDQYIFEKYIQSLLELRGDKNFKKPLSFTNTLDKKQLYIRTLIAFYKWCVNVGIFDADNILPPLNMPVNIPISTDTIIQDIANNLQGNDGTTGSNDTKGSISEGTIYNPSKFLTQKLPEIDKTIYSKELNTLLETEDKILSRYYIPESNVKEDSLDGLFTAMFTPTNKINTPIIPNFFNPRRYEDRILFKRPLQLFNNISIYRDVSGSTHHTEMFKLFDDVCNYLVEHIPVDINFYLYGSHIIETTYLHWSASDQIPEQYKEFNVGYGTNSSLIADIITQQLNDKWLNIIITDGDLDDLFNRENIDSLLNNIAVVHIGNESIYTDRLKHYVHINDMKDINNVVEMLLEYTKYENNI